MTYPASLSTRTITGVILTADGNPAAGTIRLTRAIPLQGPADDITLQPGAHTATLDNAGAYSLTVPVSDDVDWSPSGWAYTLDVDTTAWRYRADIAIPGGPPASLADLVPVTATAPDPASTYVTRASVGTASGPAGPLDGSALLPAGQVPDLSGTYTPRSYVGPSTALTAPLLSVRFSDVPAGVNLAEAHITIGGQLRLAAWLNEALRYRAEQQPGGFGYDHLITLIASHATATGVLIRFERRDGTNQRVTTGGIDQDGRLQTSLYAWQAIIAVDPDATGRYSEDTSTGVAPLAVRQESDDRTWLRGRIAVASSGTSSGHVVVTLPAGHAPTYSQLLSVPTTGGIAAPCEIMTTGDIVVRRTQAGAYSLSFDGLSFLR
ncbi:hypothetical protein [Salinispora sp. H7-4]|uniref:hypothetical protein n=1 Tax=Salinispora sp. H7-4 TaxID=2748321 RepID=UPI0015D146EA|nr:hypothetical protein [Salinispora sp. H7-4]NYT96315.1 hypothetical protein [Salinispora sp. H7-4]